MYNSLGSSRAALTAAQCLDRAEQAEQLARYRSGAEDGDSYLAEARFWRSEALRRTAPMSEQRSFSAPPTLETAAADSVVLAS